MFLNQKEKVTLEKISTNTPKIIWIEIPATDLERAIRFYQNVFNTKLTRQQIDGKNAAIFCGDEIGIKGCIMEVATVRISGGIKPTFFVDIMCEILPLIKSYGGCIINQPALLKQRNDKGEALIGKNLIDQQIGYLCEITDSEGNGLFLYSHS